MARDCGVPPGKEPAKGLGRFYTAATLATYMLREVGFPSDVDCQRTSLLDPACGDGVFLTSASRLMQEKLLSLGRSSADIVGTVVDSLYGYDIDPEAVGRCRAALLQSLWEHVEAARGLDRAFEVPTPHVYQLDALLHAGPMPECACPGTGGIPEGQVRRGFRFVVGNPPYVRIQGMSAAERAVYRERFSVAVGAFDKYCLFFERCLELLCGDGRLALVTPDKYLRSVQGTTLRKRLVTSAQVHKIISVPATLFSADVVVNPVITVASKRAADGQHAVTVGCAEAVLDEGSASPAGLGRAGEFSVPARDLQHQFWILAPSKSRRVAAALRDNLPTLGERFSVHSCIPTGLNKVYVLSQDEARRRGLEHEMLRPVIRGRDVLRWTVDCKPLQLLYPYSVDDGKVVPVGLAEFPAMAQYLGEWKDWLERRPRMRHQIRAGRALWYEMIDPRHPTIMASRKIVTPDIWRGTRFAIDSEGLFCLNSVYVLLPRCDRGVNLQVAVAWLNSSLVEALLRLTCVSLNGSYHRMSCTHLSRLPFPELRPEDARRVDGLYRQVSLALSSPASDWSARVLRRDTVRQAEQALDEIFIASLPIEAAELEHLRSLSEDPSEARARG